MPFDIDSAIQSFIAQAPLAGAGLWVAKQFMTKHQDVVSKLIETFEKNNSSCEERSKQMLDELMRIKDVVNSKS